MSELLMLLLKLLIIVSSGFIITYIWWIVNGKKESYEDLLEKYGQRFGWLGLLIITLILIYFFGDW